MSYGARVTTGIYIPASAVEEARKSGKDVVIKHPDVVAAGEAMALASGARGVSNRRETPATVGILGGLPNTEFNQRFSADKWFGSYGEIGFRDRMAREWATGQAIRMAWWLEVMTREWRFTPPKGGDRSDLLVAEFYDTAIRHHLEGGWAGLIRPFADGAWDGFVLGQPYFPPDKTFTLKDEGRTVLKGANLLQIAPIAAWTIEDWLPEEGPAGARRYGVRLYQQSTDGPDGHMGGRRSVELPASKLVHLRFMPKGDDPAPPGLGRAIAYAWRASESLSRFLLQGAEKAAFGIPQVVIGPNADPNERATVNAMISNLRVGAFVRFELPEGYSVQWHEVPWRAADILSALTYLQKEAHRSTLTQHLFTGSDNGTQALHGSQTGEFHAAADVLCRAIVSCLSEGPATQAPLKALGVLNFPGLSTFPALTFGPPRIADPLAFADALSKGIGSGFLTPDAGLEDRFRDALRLDEMPDETRERWRHRLENETPPEIGKPDDEEDAPDPEATPDADEGGESADEVEEKAPVAASDAYARARYDRMESGPRGRPVRSLECCVSLSETKGQQDSGKEAMAGVLVRWRDDAGRKYGDIVASRASSLGDVPSIPVPGQKALIEALKPVLRRVYRAGIESVEGESERLRADPELARAVKRGDAEVGADLPSPPRIALAEHGPGCGCGGPMLDSRPLSQRLFHSVALAETPKRKAKKPPPLTPEWDDGVDPEDAVDALARTTATSMAQRIMQAAMRALQSAAQGGVMPPDPASVVAESVATLSDGAERNQAQADVNQMFGLGRSHQQRHEGAQRFMFSNLLESQTCEPCEQWDGHVFGPDDLAFFATPFSECLGGDKCGCLVLGVPPDVELE